MTRDEAIKLLDGGLIREVYVALKPFAEAGDAAVMGLLGDWLVRGYQEFTSYEELATWFQNATVEELNEHIARTKQNIELGLEWLRRSSESGDWGASHNLVGFYSTTKDIDNYIELWEYYSLLADKQREDKQRDAEPFPDEDKSS